MPEAFDWSWLRDAVSGPEITLDLYLSLPEDLSRQIEVEDGRATRESRCPRSASGSAPIVRTLRAEARSGIATSSLSTPPTRFRSW